MLKGRTWPALFVTIVMTTPAGRADTWSIETPEEFAIYLPTSNIAMGGIAISPHNGSERYIVKLRKGLLANSPIGWEVDSMTEINASGWSENATRQFAWEEDSWMIWLHPYEGGYPDPLSVRTRRIEIAEDAP